MKTPHPSGQAYKKIIPSDRKHYEKRAKVFADKAKRRIHKHHRKTSQVYRNWNIQKVGIAYSYYTLDVAMEHTRKGFQQQYGQKLRPASMRFLCCVHSYCAYTNQSTFTYTDLYDWIAKHEHAPRLLIFTPREVSTRIGELLKLHFLNPLPYHAFTPTHRMNLIMKMMESNHRMILDKHFPIDQPEK
jgi:hypothetical protein